MSGSYGITFVNAAPHGERPGRYIRPEQRLAYFCRLTPRLLEMIDGLSRSHSLIRVVEQSPRVPRAPLERAIKNLYANNVIHCSDYQDTNPTTIKELDAFLVKAARQDKREIFAQLIMEPVMIQPGAHGNVLNIKITVDDAASGKLLFSAFIPLNLVVADVQSYTVVPRFVSTSLGIM